ncbi:MAG: NAD(P)H-dependent oxidoreductase [Proteiniphilum sp.]|nr:NAD(P)H-dependent oxidoreductase [Proteiniphilum sp.]
MKIVALVGAKVGWSTKVATNNIKETLENKYKGEIVDVIDLAEYDIEFADGRNFMDYRQDTAMVINKLMDADVIIITTPVYQASIPGLLKNVFDLLPMDAFQDKTVGIMVVAGSEKHFLVAEQQLKPILSFMKAQTVQSYVFATQNDIVKGRIINQDVIFRIDILVDEIMQTAIAFKNIKEAQDAMYDF